MLKHGEGVLGQHLSFIMIIRRKVPICQCNIVFLKMNSPFPLHRSQYLSLRIYFFLGHAFRLQVVLGLHSQNEICTFGEFISFSLIDISPAPAVFRSWSRLACRLDLPPKQQRDCCTFYIDKILVPNIVIGQDNSKIAYLLALNVFMILASFFFI